MLICSSSTHYGAIYFSDEDQSGGRPYPCSPSFSGRRRIGKDGVQGIPNALDCRLVISMGWYTPDQRSSSHPRIEIRSHATMPTLLRLTTAFVSTVQVCVYQFRGLVQKVSPLRYLKDTFLDLTLEPATLHGTERGRLVCLHFVPICRVC